MVTAEWDISKAEASATWVRELPITEAYVATARAARIPITTNTMVNSNRV
jgi:hypothetical protein